MYVKRGKDDMTMKNLSAKEAQIRGFTERRPLTGAFLALWKKGIESRR